MKKIKLNASKLQLNKERITELSNPEMVKGGDNVVLQPGAPIDGGTAVGFLSIGHNCSAVNSCARISNNQACYCCPNVAVADTAVAVAG